MSQEKYIGMDVHAATISAAVKNAEGKLLMECVLETKAATILEFIQGLRGTLALSFEEGTSATWLHDLLKPHGLLGSARGAGIYCLSTAMVLLGTFVLSGTGSYPGS